MYVVVGVAGHRGGVVAKTLLKNEAKVLVLHAPCPAKYNERSGLVARLCRAASVSVE